MFRLKSNSLGSLVSFVLVYNADKFIRFIHELAKEIKNVEAASM